MLRCLLRSFKLPLALQTTQNNINLKIYQPNLQLLKQLQISTRLHYKNLTMNCSSESEATSDHSKATETITGESEVEYIRGYDKKYERSANKAKIIDEFYSKLFMNEDEVNTIVNDESFLRSYRQISVLYNMETLIAEGVNKRSFIDYPWLLTLRPNVISSSLKLFKILPIEDINHFVVFMRLNKYRLTKLVNNLIRESTYVPEGNRVYYISKMLKTDPYIVTKYLSRRLFVLEIPFELLEMNLHNMIDYNVDPSSVLRDLWAFRYAPKSVQQRFQRATNAKKDKIMPWMVRCPEEILQRSLKLSLDELAVLGNKKDTVEYVAERLKFSVEATRSIMQKHPKTFTVRVTKMKEVLDYLLNEAKFTRFEIAQNIRILCHSLETTKERVNELKSYGCRPSSLVILCRSKREYKKFVDKWLSTHIDVFKKETDANNENGITNQVFKATDDRIKKHDAVNGDSASTA